jgi:hypothetical protein
MMQSSTHDGGGGDESRLDGSFGRAERGGSACSAASAWWTENWMDFLAPSGGWWADGVSGGATLAGDDSGGAALVEMCGGRGFEGTVGRLIGRPRCL